MAEQGETSEVFSRVDLGFVEEAEGHLLLSHFFPSKLGGRPAWLRLLPLPSPKQTACPTCGKPCAFLLQVYAPFENNPSCFHRSIFVFICKENSCYQNSVKTKCPVKVFRSQLAKQNDFYSDIPPNETAVASDFPRVETFSKVCRVCGNAGPKSCSKCHRAHYCSEEHQAVDWKHGHKTFCGTEILKQTEGDQASGKVLFPEYELVMDSESYTEPDEELNEKDLEKLMHSDQFKDKKSIEDLEAMAAKEDHADQQFLKFKKRIKPEPAQILRYDKGGEPLWISAKSIPSNMDIPKCKCGSPRQFEFQILPQLLTHLNIDSLKDSIDWGTIAVYTCTESCDENTYVEEVAWKQDVSAEQS